MSRIADLIDAVVAELQSGGFTQAERGLLPVFDLQQLSDLHITVLPSTVEREESTRGSVVETLSVAIGIQQRIDVDNNGDDLFDVVEDIVDFMHRRQLAALPDAVAFSIVVDPIFAPEHLDTSRVFTSVITLTYKIAIG